jgi:hemolysin D
VARGFFSPLAGSEKEREAVEKTQDLKSQIATAEGLQEAILAQDKKIAALTSNYRAQLLTEKTETIAVLGKLEQEIAKSVFKRSQLELKAPQDGIVKDLATTSRGAVVQPGMVLLTLVPKGETLLAEVQVRNEDIASVWPGQTVKLKLAAYPFQKYGLMDGTLLNIAADAQSVTTADAQPVSDDAPTAAAKSGYKALVKLQAQSLRARDGGRAHDFPLEPGMQVTAEIHKGERTVMEYLLSPVRKTLHEAGRER